MIVPHSAPTPQHLPPSDEPQVASPTRQRRNVSEPAKYWPQNSTLKIALYEYEVTDEYVQAVKHAASQWLAHINLTFEFVSGENGDVRITQNTSGQLGGASAVGTDAQNAGAGLPTMRLPRDSVMHYEIIPALTDGNFGQSETWSLSDGDIAWAKKAYPKTVVPGAQA